jgi:phosphatidylserine decarboxylase
MFKNVGDNVRLGERYAMMFFGGRVEIYLPKNVTLKIFLLQDVKAAETIIGYLNEN